MSPIDYRNAVFRDLQGRLHGDRLTVMEGLAHHGPCTTRELATAMDWDILSIRPRITELVQLGFAVLVEPTDPDAPKREGVYRALTLTEAEAVFNARSAEARDPQQTFDLAA